MSVFEREDDLVVVVWANLSDKSDFRGRPFETLTKSNSRKPLAWRLSYLQGKYSGLLPSAYLVLDESDLRSWMSPPLYGSSSREKPLLVPLSLARSVLGWHEFDVWEFDLVD